MKIKITRANFLEALKTVQNVVSPKGASQILQNVLIETGDGLLSLTATDTDISIRSAVACEVEAPGRTTLPAKTLFNAIAKFEEGVVSIEVDGENKARVSAGSATFRLNGLPAADFPQLPSDTNAFAYVLPQITLREMLRKTCYAASQDETRRTLKGVLMSFKDGKLTMVATDGRRLALVEHEVDFPVDAERDVVLPPKLVAELMRTLVGEGDLHVSVEKSQLAFGFGETRIYSKLLDEVYPNYRQVIPTQLNERIMVDRQLLLSALDRVSVLTSSTKLVFEDNRLLVLSAEDERGEARDEVPIKYDGNRIEINFDPKYVMEPLKAIDDDDVFIELNDGASPAVLKCSVPFLYVMMPLRIV